MNEEMQRPSIWDPGMTGSLPRQGAEGDFWAWARACVTGLAQGPGIPEFSGDAGADGPRLLLATHRIGGEEPGAFAGLVLAGLLARRGRRVLLVDGDEAEMVLTRRSGRLFKPGWVDMIRYGSSLDAAAVTVEWEGGPGYFLGLGSYCPPEADPEEVAGWLPGLAGDVDDVVVVAGAAAAAWRIAGARTLYVWDRLHDRPEVLDVALSELAKKDLTCDLVMACSPEPESEPEPEPVPPPAVESETGTVTPPPPAPPVAGDPPAGEDAPVQGHSSGIFRVLGLTGMVVVIMLAVFIWKFTDLGRMAEPVVSPDRGGDIVPVTVPIDSLVVPDTMVMTPADSVRAGGPAEVETPQGATATDSLTRATVPAAADSAAASPRDDEAAEPDPEALWRGFEPAFNRTVGADGWCLHVYSLRDSTAALREIRMIERRDVWAVGAPVVRRDSTRWFRIYVGSFPSRAAADSALPALKWKLKTDWAVPAVLPASAWD